MTREPACDTKTRQVLGILFLLHFVAVCLVKLATFAGEEIWWLSHISLLIAGLGLVIGNTSLPAAALIGVFVLHSLWLIDCAVGLVTGTFPIGVASYIQDADAWAWLATAHHFYLLPLLLILQARQLCYPKHALLLSGLVYGLLTVISRLWLPPEANVNYAFVVEVLRAAPHVAWANELPAALFLIVVNAYVCVGFFFPTSVVLQRWLGRERTVDVCAGSLVNAA